MSFIENKGQWLPNIEYKSELNFGNIYFEKDNFTFILIENETHNHNSEHFGEEYHHEPVGHHFKIKFLNANEDVAFETEKQSLHYYNYFLGNDESKWASNVFAYRAIEYQNLYDGIDMKVFGDADNMKYEYYVAPFQDPNQIKVQYLGIDELKIKNGNLIYETSVAGVTELKPVVYQFDGDTKINIECKYKLNKKTKTVQFEFPNGYDETKELIIDPTLIFASYSGSTLDNFGFTATYDNDGNLFGGGIAQTTFSGLIGYPSINSFNLADTTYGGILVYGPPPYFFNQVYPHGFPSDIAISKFSDDGTTLLYSTLIGGFDNEQPQSMVCDSLGNLYVYGRTYSSNFPTTLNAYDTSYNDINDTIEGNNNADIVVLKISADGTNLMGSTFVGGLGNDGVNMYAQTLVYGALKYNYADDGRGEIILDETGNVYVASTTQSNDIFSNTGVFQDTLSGGLQDACVFKLNNDLTNLEWGSYLGGTGNEAAYSLKIDNTGNLFVTGGTNSLDFPSTSGGLNPNYLGGQADGFLSKIDTNGSVLYQSTYLGTSSYDQSYFVEVDEFNDVYVFGQTTGNYEVTPNVYSNSNSSQFIHKLNNTIDTTIFSTVFGNSDSLNVNISPTAFLVDFCGNIYISGWGGGTNNSGWNPNATGNTLNMPITIDAFQATTDGDDFYIMVLSKNAEDLLYGTYYGGNQTGTNNSGEHVDGGTSRFDKDGIIYQAVCASCGASTTNFPTTPGAWSQVDSSNNCNLGVIKMEVYIPPTIVALDANPSTSGCVPLMVDFQSNLVNVNKITWDFDDGSFSSLEDPNHLFTDTGTFNVRLIGEDTTLCNLADTAYLQVIVADDSLIANFIDDIIIDCNNNSISLKAENYPTTQYLWTMGDGNTFTTDSVFHNYTNPGIYNIDLMLTDSTSCELRDSAETTIEILPTIDANIAVSDSFGCIALNVNFTNQTNILVDSLFWNFGDGNTSNLTNPNNIYNNIGNYNVSLIASDTNTCNLSDTAFATINTIDDRVFAAIQIDTIFFECDSLIMRFSSLNANATNHNWD
ncbi:MAG: PKD domain-containing protein, partial [Chitinophagales bacterium]